MSTRTSKLYDERMNWERERRDSPRELRHSLSGSLVTTDVERKLNEPTYRNSVRLPPARNTFEYSP